MEPRRVAWQAGAPAVLDPLKRRAILSVELLQIALDLDNAIGEMADGERRETSVIWADGFTGERAEAGSGSLPNSHRRAAA
jgi:hypothetical protein